MFPHHGHLNPPWHNNLLAIADLIVLHINKITLGHITHRNSHKNYVIVICLL